MGKGGARPGTGQKSRAREEFGESSKTLRVRIPEGLHLALADYASSQGKSSSAVLKEILLQSIPEEFLKKYRKPVDLL